MAMLLEWKALQIHCNYLLFRNLSRFSAQSPSGYHILWQNAWLGSVGLTVTAVDLIFLVLFLSKWFAGKKLDTTD